MPLLKWEAKLSVGIPSVDRQHQRLLELINELHDALSAGHGADAIGPVLTELLRYTQVHFKYEEELMRRHGFPGLRAHAETHAAFASQVRALASRPHANRSVVALEAQTLLRRWLVDHIRGEDQKYAPFLLSAGAT